MDKIIILNFNEYAYGMLMYICVLFSPHSSSFSSHFFMSQVYHLLVAAQKFITDNNCSESLSGSSSTWLMLVPQAIQFEDLRPSHVKEMTYLFDDTIFVKRCKAEIYDMVSKL